MQKYLTLLNYGNAINVIDFVNDKDNKDYAYITPGAVSLQIDEKNLDNIETFVKSLNVPYDIGNRHPLGLN